METAYTSDVCSALPLREHTVRLQTLSSLADSGVDNTATDRSKRQPVVA